MPLIIESTPDCITHLEGATPPNDVADFVVGDRFQDCAGFMTFGPGSTYGPDGVGATTSYMVLTWIGILVMVAVLVGWIVYENRRLIAYALAHPRGGAPAPPQPGTTSAEERLP